MTAFCFTCDLHVKVAPIRFYTRHRWHHVAVYDSGDLCKLRWRQEESHVDLSKEVETILAKYGEQKYKAGEVAERFRVISMLKRHAELLCDNTERCYACEILDAKKQVKINRADPPVGWLETEETSDGPKAS